MPSTASVLLDAQRPEGLADDAPWYLRALALTPEGRAFPLRLDGVAGAAETSATTHKTVRIGPVRLQGLGLTPGQELNIQVSAGSAPLSGRALDASLSENGSTLNPTPDATAQYHHYLLIVGLE